MTTTETPEQTAHLDSIIYSGTDAFILGCIDYVERITYRTALKANEIMESNSDDPNYDFASALAAIDSMKLESI